MWEVQLWVYCGRSSVSVECGTPKQNVCHYLLILIMFQPICCFYMHACRFEMTWNWLKCPFNTSLTSFFLSLCRYKEGGEALLVLLSSEEKGMIAQLQEKKVPINKIQWVNVSCVTIRLWCYKLKVWQAKREFEDDLSAFCRVNRMNVLCEEWAKSCSCWECMLSPHQEPVIMWLLWSMQWLWCSECATEITISRWLPLSMLEHCLYILTM